MFDYSKLRGRIREVLGTEGAFAKAINRSQNYVSAVFRGKAFMSQDDIIKAVDVLGIEVEDIGLYFFAHKVHKSGTE